jgi:hypothetical protein
VPERIPTRSVGAFISLVALLLAGCGATRIHPPADLENPAPVFLLDHGRHTSLVVSTPDGGLERYAYGDWEYYAEGRKSVRHVVAALFWSTPGALGRRALEGPDTVEAVRRQVPFVIEALYELQVERAQIEAFRARQSEIFVAAARRSYAPEAELEFVPHPREYNLGHNSNRVIADWLTELGCEVRGWPLLARWRIVPPQEEGPAFDLPPAPTRL